MYFAKNPILPGFRPDPSICRVGEDYYLATSSFAYFPGVPIYHSRDLANWEQTGHVLTRESQLPLEEAGHSAGIYAPTLRYCRGRFYMITTNISHGGNFIVTAEKPEGPWSEPYYLGEEAQGIDPSLFFDEEEDGSVHCYYVGTRPNHRHETHYNGDWEIWMQELNLETMKLIGEGKRIWKGAMHHVIWPEGPHLYKKDGYYYLMNAEGGTGANHCVTISRSRSVWGPYEGNPNNPILTHRHLGKDYPVTAVGHGDLVEDGMGNWYMVMLGSRKCEGFVNTGRDTFLAKVVWEEGWPVVNLGIGMLQEEVGLPGEPFELPPKSQVYHFYEKALPEEFLTLRRSLQKKAELFEREGYLRLPVLPETLWERTCPAYVAVRQKEYDYLVSAGMEFSPWGEGEEAGLAVLCDEKHQLRFTKMYREGKKEMTLVRRLHGQEEILGVREVADGFLTLKIRGKGQKTDFYYQVSGRTEQLLAADVDMTGLSTEKAGGFTGCTIGMYASSNGRESGNYADFAWFALEEGGQYRL
ncbi:MAG: glycoside hydrolase family 43 protein [Eubacteriales bacterium]|nr:glycoside hydrolase family 43 protein [Eubacteriales bacterium]